MKCKQCGKGRPKMYVNGVGFCDEKCFRSYMRKAPLSAYLGINIIVEDKPGKPDRGRGGRR